MHPIEHVLYYGCMFVPSLFVAQHPYHLLFHRVHLDFSPLAGHDGYDAPGGGSHYHYLHHAHFNGVPCSHARLASACGLLLICSSAHHLLICSSAAHLLWHSQLWNADGAAR
jgi:hypothetical protein